MARRPSLIKKKQKVVRKSKSENYLINIKYMGDEPSPRDSYNDIDIIKSLNWYNIMCNKQEARGFIETYLKNQAREKELKLFKKVPDSWVNNTAAWTARMINQGFNLPEKHREFIEKKLKESFSHIKEKRTTTDNNQVSIQDRIKEKANDLIADIEELVDNRETLNDFSFYEWLQKQEIPALYSPKIIEKYVPLLQELIEASEGKDQQLKEAYKIYNKKQLKEFILFVNMIIEDAERYASNTKKVRKPRKPRTVSVEKRLKNFKYQKEDNNFKIASINPEKIIGAQELWTFNTKYKTLTVLRATNREGLSVKGTSIINYDKQTSFTKRTGRKPEYFVERVLKGGKIVLRKLMDEMNKEASLAYRINENTILLKVV